MVFEDNFGQIGKILNKSELERYQEKVFRIKLNIVQH